MTALVRTDRLVVSHEHRGDLSQHQWAVRGPGGAVSFTALALDVDTAPWPASIARDFGDGVLWIPDGLDLHSPTPFEWESSSYPSCHLLDGRPCYADAVPSIARTLLWSMWAAPDDPASWRLIEMVLRDNYQAWFA